jgi:hypothetical protein
MILLCDKNYENKLCQILASNGALLVGVPFSKLSDHAQNN